LPSASTLRSCGWAARATAAAPGFECPKAQSAVLGGAVAVHKYCILFLLLHFFHIIPFAMSSLEYNTRRISRRSDPSPDTEYAPPAAGSSSTVLNVPISGNNGGFGLAPYESSDALLKDRFSHLSASESEQGLLEHRLYSSAAEDLKQSRELPYVNLGTSGIYRRALNLTLYPLIPRIRESTTSFDMARPNSRWREVTGATHRGETTRHRATEVSSRV
jgi:hypothetical protein